MEGVTPPGKCGTPPQNGPSPTPPVVKPPDIEVEEQGNLDQLVSVNVPCRSTAQTQLFKALRKTDLKLTDIQNAIKAGADVNAKEESPDVKTPKTPLQVIVDRWIGMHTCHWFMDDFFHSQEAVHIIQELVNRDADFTVAYECNESLLSVLLKALAGYRITITNSLRSYIDVLRDVTRDLIEKGADLKSFFEVDWCSLPHDTLELFKGNVTYSDDTGSLRTALHGAAMFGSSADVKSLIGDGNADALDSKGRSPIFYAVCMGQFDSVRVLLENRADVNLRDGKGHSPIFYAIDRDNIDIFRLLVDHNAELSVKDNEGRTPIFDAVDKDNADILAILIEKGAGVNAKAHSGQTPIFNAISTDKFAMVKLLLAKEAEVDILDKFYQSPMAHAVATGLAKTIKLLMAHTPKPNINIQDNLLQSPIFHAVDWGNIEMVKLLIENGADVDIKDYKGQSPIFHAVERDNIEMVKLFISKGADINISDTEGRIPIDCAHGEEMKKLFKMGNDEYESMSGKPGCDTRDERGHHALDQMKPPETPGPQMQFPDDWLQMPPELINTLQNIRGLLEPTSLGNLSPELITILQGISQLNAGAASALGNMPPKLIDALKIISRKALSSSPGNMSQDLTNFLKSISEVVTSTPENEAIQLFVILGNINKLVPDIGTLTKELTAIWKSIRLLVVSSENTNNPDAKDDSSRTVLHKAAVSGDTEVLSKTLANVADDNAKDKWGRTPIFYAVHMSHLDSVEKLIQMCNGIDIVNAKDHKGQSPMFLAKDAALVRLLLDKGADINSKDKKGRSPLFYAIERSDIKAVKVLIENGADVKASGITKRLLHYSVFSAYATGHQTLDMIHDPKVAISSYGKSINITGALYFVLDPPSYQSISPFVGSHFIATHKTRLKHTILHMTASLGLYDRIKLLLYDHPRLLEIIDHEDDIGQTCLHCAVQIGSERTVETLLGADADPQKCDKYGKSVLHFAAIFGHCDIMKTFIEKYPMFPTVKDKDGRNCLHHAVIHRRTEVIEYLLKEKYNEKVDELKLAVDKYKKKPVDYLTYACDKGTILWKFLHTEPTPANVNFPIQILAHSTKPKVHEGAGPLSQLAKRRGIGSVKTFGQQRWERFRSKVENEVHEVITEALGQFANISILGIGSSFEETKICLPDEFDFMIDLKIEIGDIKPYTQGYFMVHDSDRLRMSSRGKSDNYSSSFTLGFTFWLWCKLMNVWMNEIEMKKDKPMFDKSLPPQRYPDRTSCVTWVWSCNHGEFPDLAVSLDFVLATGLGPEKKTYAVAKVPNKVESFADRDLESEIKGCRSLLWRYSYPRREVDLISNLDDDIKNVYITAKCLRQLDVCGFQIEKENGNVVPISDFVTSYRMKTSFLHLLKTFQDTHMSLEERVLMVFQLLEKCLEKRSLPTFFDHDMDVLAGSKLDLEKSQLAARKMTEFVRSWCERDAQSIDYASLEEKVQLVFDTLFNKSH